MPAPVLRHYYGAAHAPAVAATFDTIVPAIPVNRALVVSKVTISRAGATDTVDVTVSVGNAAGTIRNIVNGMSLNRGEQWTESGIILLAGESLHVYSGTASSLTVHVFGQEVDN